MNSRDTFSLLHLPAAVDREGPSVLIDLDRVQRPSRRPKGGEFIRMCSWCQRVADGAQWVSRGNMPESAIPDSRPITHGICPACVSQLLPHDLLTA